MSESITDQLRNIKIALYQAEEHSKEVNLALDAARMHTVALEHQLQKEMRDGE